MKLPALPKVPEVVERVARRMLPYLLPVVISSALARFAIKEILAQGHQPGMPLDDSYIHFVYARRFAEGHPFTFGLGDGFSSGATSFLWPLVLSPFWLVGFRGLSLIYIVWLLGTLLHAAVAVETKRLAEKIAGRAAATGAAAMCLLFGAFAWFAWSGMETMALTWSMTRTARVASELAETAPEERTRRQALHLGAMGLVTTLVRPEGGVMAVVAIGAILAFAPAGAKRGAKAIFTRLPALLPAAGIAWVPLLNLAMVGHARSTTAMVKWAVGNPYIHGPRLWDFISGNVGMLLKDLLSGGPYTAIFLPEHSHYVFLGGAVALPFAAYRNRRVPRGVFIALLALSTLVPCTFITILWNRVRYIWPYAPSWFVLVACLGSELGWVANKLFKESAFVPALVTGVYAGALAGKLTWSIDDLANSSRAITEQQVKLGIWAEENLPKDARIGLNDTGAIAYFSERRTFDVVGLTTEGEAPYWVAGAGSRYEHYEKMRRDALPTHFIVYPQWFACPSVLGDQLYEATVLNQSILGGATKVVYEADWSVLGRGDRPAMRDREAELSDELDVSDLQSESSHGYLVFESTEGDNLVTTYWNDEGERVSDGGRLKRTRERFQLDFSQTEEPVFVARLAAHEAVRLTLAVDGAVVSNIDLPASAWSEVDVPMPKGLSGKRTIEITAPPGQTFGALHYWLFAK